MASKRKLDDCVGPPSGCLPVNMIARPEYSGARKAPFAADLPRGPSPTDHDPPVVAAAAAAARQPTRLCVMSATPFRAEGRCLLVTLDIDSLAIAALQVVDYASVGQNASNLQLLRAAAVADACALVSEHAVERHM
jgi:hypothetical protein